MDDNFINNFNNANNGGGEIVIGLLLLLFLAGLFLFVFFIIKKKPEDGEGEGGDTWGARSPAPAQALAIVPPDEAGGEPTFDQAMKLIADLLVGVAAGAVAEAIVKRSYKAITSSVKNLMKAEFRANGRFLRNLRPKNAARAIQKGWRKLMTTRFANLSVWAKTRYGLMWARSLAARGVSQADILAKLVARYGAQRGAALAARASTRVATKLTTMGPLMAAELAVTGVSLGLDMTNTGGYMSIEQRKTSDLLVQRQTTEAIQKNSYIQGPPDEAGNPDASQAIGFYPAYWGPLDEMNATVDADGLDYVDILVEGKMFELLFADEPDPFMLKLFENVARRYGVTTNDVQEALNASMLNDLTQEDYWGLYDRAFEGICIANGGVMVDPGTGHPKQCSHASEQRCHAFSPWVDHEGPTVDPDVDYTYAEWRNKDFFERNYQPAVLPSTATGACIIQDPSIHEMCDSEEFCTSSGCAYNEYIRNMGVCQNTRGVCNVSGVSTCERMRKPGGSGDTCGTGAGGSNADLGPGASILPGNGTLRSCYISTGQYWAEMLLPTGSSIYRWFASGGPAALDQSIVNSQLGHCDVFKNDPLEQSLYQQCTLTALGSPIDTSGNYVANWGWTGGSDIRLKKNLKKTGRKIGKLDEYTWEWNDLARSLNINDPTTGVLAQEAIKHYAESVSTGDHGYYIINYQKLYNLVK
jgi:hypothetical protein